MRSRRAAREWAMRILYAHEMSGNAVEEIFTDMLSAAPDDPNLRFCRELCRRAAEKDGYIDQLIQKAVQKWDLNRIAVLDHVILRVAIAEFLYFDDIPFKVTINEAIELAKRYSTDQSGRFVNGILDALSTELQMKVQKPSDLSTGVPTP
jgi:transcription antitermination protein NusB